MDSNDAKPGIGAGAGFGAGRIVVVENADLRELAKLVGIGTPSNLDIPPGVRPVRALVPATAKPFDPAEMARITAGLERKNDELREELSQCRERVRHLADTVAAQTKRIAELQALAAAHHGASPGPDGVMGDPDWTPPMSLLPRGMR